MTQNQFEQVYGVGSLAVLSVIYESLNADGYTTISNKELKKKSYYPFTDASLSNIFGKFEKDNVIFRRTKLEIDINNPYRLRKIYFNKMGTEISALINYFLVEKEKWTKNISQFKHLLNVVEASKILKVSPKIVLKMVHNKVIKPSFNLGNFGIYLFQKSDLDIKERNQVTALFGTAKEFYQSSGIEKTQHEIKIKELQDEVLRLKSQMVLNQEQLTLKICLLEFFQVHSNFNVLPEEIETLVGGIMQWHYKVMEAKK